MRSSSFSRLLLVTIVLPALAACASKDANADSELSRDLALAAEGTPLAEPVFADTAASTPAPPPTPRPQPRPAPPRQPTAQPAPAPRAPTTGTVASGARMMLASDTRVCTNSHRVGDRFTATLRDPVFGSDGSVIPAGSKAEIEITALKRSENANDEIVIGLAVRAIETNGKRYPVQAETKQFALEKVRASNDAKKVVGGAVIGAVVGQAIGRDTRSTVIGAATGAAAGTAAAVATANHEGCVPAEGQIEVVLTSSLTIPVARN